MSDLLKNCFPVPDYLEPGCRVVVAMSGGVDSSASAVILNALGFAVIGVSMQVWDYRNHGGNGARATCCAPSDFDDARIVAEKFGFPYYVFDFEDQFRQSVIQPFIENYLSGRTPNPCVDCNRRVKFKQLRERAATLGAACVATGHYARIVESDSGLLRLFTAVDLAKDQSYFLYALKQEELRRTVFPVGYLTKPQVRGLLAGEGIATAQKAESQDICFVSSSAAEFVEKHAGGRITKGKIYSEQGQELGEHAGVHNFTIGQRRGLKIAASDPLYVLNIDAATQVVTVGARGRLERRVFDVGDLNWISGVAPKVDQKLAVKVRYRHVALPCKLLDVTPEFARVELNEDWTAISPGQAAVFYGGQSEDSEMVEVLGGGTIC